MFKKTLYTVALCAIVVGGVWLFRHLLPAEQPFAQNDSATQKPIEIQTVQLPATKLPSAKIDVATVEMRSLQATRILPGRLDYDQDRHIAIKSACDGILTQVRVQPGQQVKRGQILAIVSSPEVGQARNEVQQQLADRDLARMDYQRHQAVCDGVEQLVKLIRDEKTPDEIRAELKDESLGDYRRSLVEAYTRSRLAKTTVENSRDAAARGVIAARIQRERESEQQASDAALQSLADQALFDVRQQCKMSESKFKESQRNVDISLQRLNALLGPAAIKATENAMQETRSDSISSVEMAAPIDGTVEERLLTASERVMAGDSIFTLADTTHLWAVADVRQRDWAAIGVTPGQSVTVTLPAIPDVTLLGEILIVGRRVDQATGAASLIAALQSSDPRLRPGLFIRMTVPTGPPRDGIAVPEQAVVVHEDQSFVFIAESDTEFRRVDVQTGSIQDGIVEVTEGLNAGDQIVVEGVFKLKSELLLAGEEE